MDHHRMKWMHDWFDVQGEGLADGCFPRTR
jgi:hypothetical protein